MARRVAILGTGIMGAGMAERLLDRGFAVDVWDRTPEAAARIGERGAAVHADPAEAVRAADVVITMMATPQAAFGVMLEQGALDAIRPGAAWAQMATLGVAATEHLAAEVAPRRPDVAFVDAAVSGTKEPARNGQLTMLASGPEQARSSLAPVFEALGERVLWLGKAGLGTRLKLVLNTWLAFEVEAVAEAGAIAERLRVPYGVLLDAVQDGPLASRTTLARLDKMQRSDHSAQFPLEWALKDLDLTAEAAGPQVSPVAGAISERWRRLYAQGLGRLDVSAARIGLTGEAPVPEAVR